MPRARSSIRPHVQDHKDGSVWARGQTLDGLATGYWGWFCRDGIRICARAKQLKYGLRSRS
jgi:hypothetical protein